MLTDLTQTLSGYGLLIRGGFNVQNDKDIELSEIKVGTKSLVMVGVAGSAFWPKFETSQEYKSYLAGEADPLDRWSKRIGDQIAKEFSGFAVYPFSGPPYYPFIQWAKRCETLHSSKMGFSIHPEYGLWHAFRFALLLPKAFSEFESNNQDNPINPCETCSKSPCLNTCPVGAYTISGFDPDACFKYLSQNENGECRTKGCIARRSCPEGADYVYVHKHAEFHMTAFYQSQLNINKNIV